MARMSAPPEEISDISQFKNTLSPIYVPITAVSLYTHIRLDLWVWNTDLQAPYTLGSEPTVSLYQEKINYSDTTILFEISEYVRSKNKPMLNYQGDLTTLNAGQVFFKWEATLINNTTNESNPVGFKMQIGQTYVGLLGYNYNFQNSNSINFDFSYGVKKLDVLSSDYRFIDGASYFDTTLNLGAGNDVNINDIVIHSLVPHTANYCPKERYVIWFINQGGFWDYFTPTGKVSVESVIKRDTYNRTVVRPDLINSSQYHGIKQFNLDTTQTWTINTGFMNERLGQVVESIISSPMVYLIQITDGLSPGTYIHRQIPLINDDTSFGRKTRINNKGKISYQMKFKETTNKILNNR